MEFYAKIVKSCNCFSKVFYLISSKWFWIHPSLNKYSLACTVNMHYVLYETYSDSCHIQNPGIFRTLDIFRTLSRHILAYSEHCVTLVYWEPCHFQNFTMFRTGGIFAILFIWSYSIMIVIRTLTLLFSLWSYILLNEI